MLIQLGRNDIRIEFFKMLKRKCKAYIRAKYNAEIANALDSFGISELFKYPTLGDDLPVCLWIKGTLDLLTENAWYEADGRHARRVRSYWKQYVKNGGTPPYEITEEDAKLMVRGDTLFMSGTVKFD